MDHNYLFNHCVYKSDQPSNSNYVNGFKNQDPLFSSFSRMTISSTSSPAHQNADSNYFLNLDIDRETRTSPADIGCFKIR